MKDRFDTFLSRYMSAKAWLVLHATLQSFGGRLGGATEAAGSGLAAVNGLNGQPFPAPLRGTWPKSLGRRPFCTWIINTSRHRAGTIPDTTASERTKGLVTAY